eukprot:GHVR01135600.1.p1 GENE.GHVR01135600.1~~GHVR01135600.1.p1  ORF type:complete len:202 (-),score=13.91 GHVR01135600.1:1905-2510(-)
MRNICTINDCQNFVSSHGLCVKHSKRLKRNGHPLKLQNGIPQEPRKWKVKGDIATVKTPCGKKIIADAIDVPELGKHNWCLTNGYPSKREGKNIVFLHRHLMKPEGGLCIDHINHNILDARRSNLRICTYQQNSSNRKEATGKSKYKGVFFSKVSNKWTSIISHKRNRYHLGLFQKEKDAAKAYNIAAIFLHRDFAYLNSV